MWINLKAVLRILDFLCRSCLSFFSFSPPEIRWVSSRPPGRAVSGAGLGRVYFRSSWAHWSDQESISIKRIWVFCWGIATQHIYPIWCFPLWLWQCVRFSHQVFCSSSSLRRWEMFFFLSVFSASLRPEPFIYPQLQQVWFSGSTFTDFRSSGGKKINQELGS